VARRIVPINAGNNARLTNVLSALMRKVKHFSDMDIGVINPWGAHPS
jgi:hypothetical protein